MENKKFVSFAKKEQCGISKGTGKKVIAEVIGIDGLKVADYVEGDSKKKYHTLYERCSL
jgi:hypothetical protein